MNNLLKKNSKVSSTCFQPKKNHKATWETPDGNQIDHTLIEKRPMIDTSLEVTGELSIVQLFPSKDNTLVEVGH